MKQLARSFLSAVIFASLTFGTATAADLSMLGQWTGKYPFDKLTDGKSLWDQPGVQAAMRAGMGEHYFALSEKEMHGPEGPVASDGKGLFAVWSGSSHDSGGNQMTVFFDTSTGAAQICWRESDDQSGKVQDLWLADGKARPLSSNACGYGAKNPFGALKKFAGGK